jgi:hypothetical protein
MWATLLIGMSSIKVTSLEVTFGAIESILPLLLPSVLVYGAFYILLGRAAPLYFSRRGGGSESMTMKSQLSVPTTTTTISTISKGTGQIRKKGRHQVSTIDRLRDALKLHGIAAALLVTIALIGLHWSIYSGIIIEATIKYNIGLIIIGMVVGLLLCGLATHLFFHFRTSQFRFVSAFIMAAGICGMHFITLSSCHYYYNKHINNMTTTDDTSSSSSSAVVGLNSTILQIIGSVSMALMSFLFIGLNVIRLKLSRDHLEKDVRDARQQIDQLHNLVMIERSISSDLQRKIDLINLCRPLSRTSSIILSNILLASSSEREEMLRIHKRALDNQRAAGGGGIGGIGGGLSAGLPNTGGGIIDNEGNILTNNNDTSDDENDHVTTTTNKSEVAMTPINGNGNGNGTGNGNGGNTKNGSDLDSPEPIPTPNPRLRALTTGVTTTTTHTSHGDTTTTTTSSGFTGAVNTESQTTTTTTATTFGGGLGVITSTSTDNISVGQVTSPIHRDDSPLLGHGPRGGNGNNGNNGIRSSSPNINNISTPTSSMGNGGLQSPTNVMVTLPGTPSHAYLPEQQQPRMSIVTGATPMPPSPRGGGGGGGISEHEVSMPPPLVSGKSFGLPNTSSPSPNHAANGPMITNMSMGNGLASIRGVPQLGSPQPVGASSRTGGNKYSIVNRPPASATLPSVTTTPTHAHYIPVTAVNAPHPSAHSVSVHDVGDELMLINSTHAKPGTHGNANLSDTAITLDIIIAHPVTVEILKDRLASLHASETLQFYLEIQSYKRSPQVHLKRLAVDIFDTYIQVHSENQVNFGATLRESIAKRVRDPRPTHGCFKEAEREAYRLLIQNAWPPFHDSPQFTMCALILRGLVPPPDRPRGGLSIHWQAVAGTSDLSHDSGSMVTDTSSNGGARTASVDHGPVGSKDDDEKNDGVADRDAVQSYAPQTTPSLRVVEA